MIIRPFDFNIKSGVLLLVEIVFTDMKNKKNTIVKSLHSSLHLGHKK